jgi:hypothetical protein
MTSEAVILVRVVASGVFITTLCAGYYLLKNYQQFFGVDANMPSEGQSSRAYSQVQAFVIWAHVLFASAAIMLSAG